MGCVTRSYSTDWAKILSGRLRTALAVSRVQQSLAAFGVRIAMIAAMAAPILPRKAPASRAMRPSRAPIKVTSAMPRRGLSLDGTNSLPLE